MNRIRTFIVDDHAAFRELLKKVLARYSFIEVIGEAESAEETLKKVDECDPELVTVDINLPKMNGFELTRRLKKLNPVYKVILISINGNPVFQKEAKRLNCPYVPKESLFHDLPRALEWLLNECGGRKSDSEAISSSKAYESR